MTAYELRISDWSSDVCSSDLLTHEDEFTTFILNLCGLEPGLSKRELWRRVLLSFGSPFFHLRFLLSRISSCLLYRSTLHNLVAIAVWAGLIAAAVHSGMWAEFAIAWLLPLVVLFQIATALERTQVVGGKGG